MIEKRGSSFRVKFHTRNGKRLHGTFKTRGEAEEWENIMAAKKILGQLNEEINVKSAIAVVYNDLVKMWYKTDITQLATSTKREYKSCIEEHFFPFLRAKDIKSITSKDCDEVFRKLSKKGLSARTINKRLVLLKQIFNFAVKRDLLDKNPARNIKNLKVQPPKDLFLSDSEIKLLLNKSRHEWFHGAILMALNTGMRIGEVAGLQWDMIDFENKIINVTRNMTKEGLNDFTKTHVKKAIPMTTALYDYLCKHKKNKLLSKFVIIDEKGLTIRPDHFTTRHFKPLTKGTVLDKYGFHSLRHTFASQFMMRGGSLFDLQKFLGHSKIEMTMRYAHLSQDYLHEKIQIVNFE